MVIWEYKTVTLNLKRIGLQKYKKIYLKDYKPYEYKVPFVDLTIDFFNDHTIVKSKLQVESTDKKHLSPLILKGEELITKSIKIDGKEADKKYYSLNDDELIIYPVNSSFEVETVCEIHPETNTSLEGIYKSDDLFCSQCEAEGFRKITWHPDRPDVLSKFTCTVLGDKDSCPVLLSNGNPVEKGELEGGRHYVKWHDPFLKPSYLFAVVAGSLYCVDDNYTTMSGRNVALKIFTEPENKNKCFYAMESLKKAMKWDEDVFSREYDLDIYMIVAVRAFNMGAMENKGLNIFNSTYVLADEKSGTDDDFINIESVIAHEYFHNWTGNRITLANWFQLSLKEGLTVFRDQLFSSEVGAGSVARIRDVKTLKARQFPEDAGPFSHPVRPSSYIEMNNFYTATVYEKGAEIVRMIYNWLGREEFLKGMNAYFEAFDSMAVACEDFINIMEQSSNKSLKPFLGWYEQSGTPCVEFKFDYNQELMRLTMCVSQKTPPTPDQVDKKALPIPVKAAFFDESGNQMEFLFDNEVNTETVFLLESEKEERVFENLKSKPVVSLFRGFSAPVRYDYLKDMNQDIFIMANDSDSFNRWEASQRVYFEALYNIYNDFCNGNEPFIPEDIYDAISKVLSEESENKSLTSEILTLPALSEVIQDFIGRKTAVNPFYAAKGYDFFEVSIAEKFKDDFLRVYNENNSDKYIFSKDEISKRRLKNTALSYIAKLDESDFVFRAYEESDNMTDTISALKSLLNYNDDNCNKAFTDFYEKWKQDPVVMDKWFAVQASFGESAYERVLSLMKDCLFSIKNPNRVRSVIGAFANNPKGFHRKDGKGYDFLKDQIIALSELNPQISARMVNFLSNYNGFESEIKEKMYKSLEQIYEVENLPKDVYEMICKSLGKEVE